MDKKVKNMYEVFMSQHRFCWSCGVQPRSGQFWGDFSPGLEYPRNLENHHICSGAGRVNVRENLARLCKLCHDLYHGARVRVDGSLLPQLTFENLLWLKREFDVRNYNPVMLAKFRHRNVHDPEPLPAWQVAEYRRRMFFYPSEERGEK